MIPRDIQASAVKIVGATPDDVMFESVLEEDYLFLVRFDHTVKAHRRFAGTIKWINPDGGEHSYTPDFEVEFHPDATGKTPNPLVVEIKPDFLENPDPFKRTANLPRKPQPHEAHMWETARRNLLRYKKRFKVVRESEIRTPRLQNALLLLPYLERSEERPPARDVDLVIDALDRAGPSTLRQVANMLAENLTRRAEVLRSCYYLIATRRIHADLDRALHFESMLRIANEPV